MDRSVILARLDHERRRLARHGEVVELLPSVTRLRGADGSWHLVAWSSLAAETADDAIEREIDHHRRLGVSFEWKVFGHDAPPDMLERLRRHGFEVGPREAIVVFDLSWPQPWAAGPACDELPRRPVFRNRARKEPRRAAGACRPHISP